MKSPDLYQGKIISSHCIRAPGRLRCRSQIVRAFREKDKDALYSALGLILDMLCWMRSH